MAHDIGVEQRLAKGGALNGALLAILINSVAGGEALFAPQVQCRFLDIPHGDGPAFGARSRMTKPRNMFDHPGG